MLRILDIGLSLFMIVLFFIPMVLISIAILLEDGRPIIFRQIRVGRKLESFIIFKFRSMANEPIRSDCLGVNETIENKLLIRNKFLTTVANDIRITSVGSFIRKMHLDELPQLFNVLLGDMSIVGVRPDTPVQEVDYSAEYWKKRHTYIPGISGLAQVMSDQSDGMVGRSYWEMKWINERSLWLYFYVLFKTVEKMLRSNSN